MGEGPSWCSESEICPSRRAQRRRLLAARLKCRQRGWGCQGGVRAEDASGTWDRRNFASRSLVSSAINP